MKFNNLYKSFLLFACLAIVISCSRDVDGLEEAGFPVDGNVYLDGFSGGLNYAAFGGSDVTAFDVDQDVKYQGTSSMRISVPDFGDPRGAYAGGVYFVEGGRDLSGFNVLTFWAKASKNANIDLIGFGNDLGENKYVASIESVPVNTNWKKYYIPIPDPAKLVKEKGMFYYSEGPEDEKGYTIWFDEVKFEKLGTVAHGKGSILDGEDVTALAETGSQFTLNGISTFNLPTGVNQDVLTAAAYFNFEFSQPNVATIDNNGIVNVIDAGTTVVRGTLAGNEIDGSLRIISSGDPILPEGPAPTPTENQEDVISIFSNVYEDVPVDFYNGYWEFSTTTSDVVQVQEDDILRYKSLNFVGIQFTTPTIDINDMNHFHIDIWTPDATASGETFKILLVDLGPDGTFDGGDNATHELTFTAPVLKTEEWVSLDIPLVEFAGLTTKSNLAQIVLSGDLPNVFVDNMYFYDDGMVVNPSGPQEAAPTPTNNPNDVISVFSDAFTNISGVNYYPDWGQSNVVSEVNIQGNNTLRYSALDYQGIEFAMSENVSEMEFLHLDFWTDNSSELNVFLISPGPNEVGFSLNVPTSGWASADIPLSNFSTMVDLMDVFQMKFDGNGTIYLDNIYFYKEGSSGGGEPTDPAPDPTLDPVNVISLFSDVYNDVTVDTWRTDWSSATLEDISISGNAVKKYTGLDFVGIETVAEQVDATDMTHIHLNVWSSDFTFFAIKLVDFGADGAFEGGDDVEHQIDIPMPAQNTWISLDIPLADFTGLTTRANIAQYILVGQPTGSNTIYVDNVYFHN